MNGHPFDSRHTWPERHNWLITQTSRVDSKSRQSELHSLPVRKKNIHDIICDIQGIHDIRGSKICEFHKFELIQI